MRVTAQRLVRYRPYSVFHNSDLPTHVPVFPTGDLFENRLHESRGLLRYHTRAILLSPLTDYAPSCLTCDAAPYRQW